MLTYEASTKTLFSCDMYGAFGRMVDHHFDDELTPEEVKFFEDEGIRYFSNVMTTFIPSIRKAIEKTKELDIQTIAPGHGPVYRSNPQKIINDYYRFSQYAQGAGKREVTILWGSMYGMTEKAVNHIKDILEKQDLTVNTRQMPQESHSEMIATVFKSAAIIIAAPTYEYRLFPPIATAMEEIGRKKISGKTAFRFGSYGWSGGAENELKGILERNKMNWNFIESVEFQGSPKPEDLRKIEEGVMETIKRMQDKIVE
jgi:flavorubredoxin